jgi:hypothetical protein
VSRIKGFKPQGLLKNKQTPAAFLWIVGFTGCPMFLKLQSTMKPRCDTNCWEYISKIQGKKKNKKKTTMNKHHESIAQDHAKQKFAKVRILPCAKLFGLV